MIKKIILSAFLLLFFSCDYFKLQKAKKVVDQNPIAVFGEEKLYLEEIKAFFSTNMSEKDSVIFAKSLINKWALKQVLFQKSKLNSSVEEIESVEELVQDYRESLLINNYKQKLIRQRLDTVVTEEEIVMYYVSNEANFRLNEELVKIKYVQLANDNIHQKEIIELFNSDEIDALSFFEQQQLNFIKMELNDSIWRSLDNVLLNTPFSKEILLKKTNFIQKQDSLGLYLVAVKEVLKRNEIAPLSHISSTIKQLILHQRKLELIKEIEKTLLKDATQNKNFKIY